MLIVVGAGFLSRVMRFLGIPAALTQAILHMQLPLYFLMLLTTLILAVFPEIVLYLPHLMTVK
jgi:TRAP-type C4-dicarboxylate transport system permease large subunit